jgi:hypothetical protein
MTYFLPEEHDDDLLATLRARLADPAPSVSLDVLVHELGFSRVEIGLAPLPHSAEASGRPGAPS